MEQIFSKLKFITYGEGFIDITNDLNLYIEKNNFHSGILNLSSLHTSCSLTINENADPNVLRDLKKYMQSIVPCDSYLTLSKIVKKYPINTIKKGLTICQHILKHP